MQINANKITEHDLLECAVAAGVSASFNTPIANTIFALEMVLRHYTIHTFTPIAITTITNTVMNQLEFSNVTKFALPKQKILTFY